MHYSEQDVESLKNIECDPNVNQESLNDEYTKYFIKYLGHKRQTSYNFFVKLSWKIKLLSLSGLTRQSRPPFPHHWIPTFVGMTI